MVISNDNPRISLKIIVHLLHRLFLDMAHATFYKFITSLLNFTGAKMLLYKKNIVVHETNISIWLSASSQNSLYSTACAEHAHCAVT